MGRLMFYILVVYAAYTQWLIHGYDVMNDRLQKANAMLLSSCANSPIAPIEKHQYQ